MPCRDEFANGYTTKTIALDTYQAELIEQALAFHEMNARDISDDLFVRADRNDDDLDMSKELYADAVAMHALRKQLVTAFKMGHVDI